MAKTSNVDCPDWLLCFDVRYDYLRIFLLTSPVPSKTDRLHWASSFTTQFSIAGISELDKYQGFGSNVLNGLLGNIGSVLVDAYDAWKGINSKKCPDAAATVTEYALLIVSGECHE
ncbi:MAG: hypothetical protein J0G35_08745 [Acidobacteriales bacterium]|nr:hypothetical protein [Terriglobales bacterium]